MYREALREIYTTRLDITRAKWGCWRKIRGWNDQHHDQRASRLSETSGRGGGRDVLAGACRCRRHQPSQDRIMNDRVLLFLRGTAKSGTFMRQVERVPEATGVPTVRISHAWPRSSPGRRRRFKVVKKPEKRRLPKKAEQEVFRNAILS